MTDKLEALSIRISPDLLLGLRKAQADRLVSREEPRKQQDIIMAGLRDWLVRHDYMAAQLEGGADA